MDALNTFLLKKYTRNISNIIFTYVQKASADVWKWSVVREIQLWCRSLVNLAFWSGSSGSSNIESVCVCVCVC